MNPKSGDPFAMEEEDDDDDDGLGLEFIAQAQQAKTSLRASELADWQNNYLDRLKEAEMILAQNAFESNNFWRLP